MNIYYGTTSMAQSKKRSWQEAWFNIFVGFSINYVANILILPLFGFKNLTPSKNFVIGILYTGISLVRQYVIRRWFNKGDDR